MCVHRCAGQVCVQGYIDVSARCVYIDVPTRCVYIHLSARCMYIDVPARCVYIDCWLGACT